MWVDIDTSLILIPVFNVVGTNWWCTLNAFAKMRINWWSWHRLKTFQLTRRGHIETLHEIVENSNRNDHENEHVRWHADDNECWQYLLYEIHFYFQIENERVEKREDEERKEKEKIRKCWKCNHHFQWKKNLEKNEKSKRKEQNRAWSTINNQNHFLKVVLLSRRKIEEYVLLS